MRLELVTVAADTPGRRSPVLCIHGVYHAAWCWENYLTHFAYNGFNTHALSLRGHGGSEGKEFLRRARFRDYLEDVQQTAQKFDEPPILIGHSLGGMLTQRYIEENEVAAAVLVSTSTSRSLRQATLPLLRAFPRQVAQALVTFNPDHLYKNAGPAKALLFGEQLINSDLRVHIDRVVRENESRRIFMDVSFLRFHAPRKPAPVLVVGGGRDFGVPRSAFEENAAIYDTSAVIFEDMPHDLMLAEGWQTPADHILNWLKKLGL